jgi:hypothetical protein
MARGHARSAKTGRYVSKATAARHPRTTVTESTSGKGGGKAYRSHHWPLCHEGNRSAAHPGTTVTENG